MLSRELFSTYALFIPPVAQDDTSRFIFANARHAMALPAGLDAARRAIADLGLDILFYQDIGMEPVSYFLAHARLAPVQCVSFGHPDTTGIPNVDYFISNDLFEPPGAAAHYSEKLYLLHDLGTLAYYYRPAPAPRQPTRAELGLPEGVRIYYCPQTPYKFHPDLDAVLEAILRSDPDGMLAVPRPRYPAWESLLLRRIERTLGDRMNRVLVIPQRPRDGFLSLLGAADVLLDTLHFNGMNTSLLGFAAGTPIVTLPGAFQRGRHTAGMYRKMGVSECVASSPEDYVDIALRVARDRDYRKAIQDKIAARRDVLFEDDRVVREFERFFLEAAAAASA
jgi:predicted O-linked N-acetylglucosamine transferase (SPINDLY family)